MGYWEKSIKAVCIELNLLEWRFHLNQCQFFFRLHGVINFSVLVFMLAPLGAYAQVESPASLSFSERSRVWNETMEKQRLAKKRLDEKILNDLLTKVKNFVEVDDFSVSAVERAFNLKLEVSEVLASPDPKTYGVRTLYVAREVDFPFSTACPQKNINLNPRFDPTYWYRSTTYVGADDRNIALVLFYPLSAWAEANPWDVSKSVFNQSNWTLQYAGQQHAEPLPFWTKSAERYGYEFSFHQASDNCGAMVLNRALNR